MIKLKNIISEDFQVLGYIRPADSFHTLAEWRQVVDRFLKLQREGYDTRGGKIASNPELIKLITKYFGYQLHVETQRYELLTVKNILDFIEDFVNHRFWSIAKEYGKYFPDINSLKFAYFYSRGDIEPYVMLDDAYTMQLYKSLDNPKKVMHYTTARGVKRIQSMIKNNKPFDISTFTIANRAFFRKQSNLVVEMIGNVRAGFKSDVKSYALDNGKRACNLYRLGYPSDNENNICYELDSCDGSVATSLWNEYIVTPVQILNVKRT